MPDDARAREAHDWEAAAPIIESSGRALARLAYLGDKRFLFNFPKTSFVMYGARGRSRVALGDPLGPPEEAAAMIRRFVTFCRLSKARPVFYNISQSHLEHCLAERLSVYKIGEEARISLPAFTPSGAGYQKLRQLSHRYEKEGASFEVLAAGEGEALFPTLKDVSDRWLSRKRTREKGFSMGFCSAEYLRRFPIAVVRKGPKILAFTNVCRGAGFEELSGDLVRFVPEEARSAMDYLFLQLMLWGKRQGFRWFNLGMAPLSGLRGTTVSPVWNRLGTFVFSHGEHFYHFQGLRAYKEKFHPVWVPRYLVCPGGLRLPSVVADVAALVAGGWKGILGK